MADERCVIYLRVSTLDQHPENQEPELRAYAERMGWDVHAVYSEQKSGADRDRPEYQRMLDDVRKGYAQVVLVWALDRFGRIAIELEERMLEFKQRGVRFVSFKENLDTSLNGLVMDILLAVYKNFAQAEREKISERTKAGLERARKEGKRIGNQPYNKTPEGRLKIDLAVLMKHGGASDGEVLRETGMNRGTFRKYVRPQLKTEGVG